MSNACEWHPADQGTTVVTAEPPRINQRFQLANYQLRPVVIGSFGAGSARGRRKVRSPLICKVWTPSFLRERFNPSVEQGCRLTGYSDQPITLSIGSENSTAVSKLQARRCRSFNSRATVPALVDVQTGAVVNNDANGLLNELTGPAWARFRHGVDLVPADLQDRVASKSAEILHDVNRASGNLLQVTSQAAYDQIAQTFSSA